MPPYLGQGDEDPLDAALYDLCIVSRLVTGFTLYGVSQRYDWKGASSDAMTRWTDIGVRFAPPGLGIHPIQMRVIKSTRASLEFCHVSMASHPARDVEDVQYLNDDEINRFLDDLDHNDDGYIDYGEVEHKLDAAHDKLKLNSHHVRKHEHDSHGEKDEHDEKARHVFLRSLMGSDAQRIPRAEFRDIVRSWKIPSLEQAKKEEQEEDQYVSRLHGWRRARAYWAVHGPEIGFLGLVVAMQLAFGIWQLVKYQTTPQYRDALGWGVVMAKTSAGVLYPTFFFLILSMSRYFSTWLRRSYYISRFFNWDLSQDFHIRISCVAIFFATLHAIGHLSGSFVSASRPENQDAVARLLGPDMVPLRYVDLVRSLPGFTGLTALGLLYVLSLLSIPQVRRWNYEVFQLGHLLMFPIIGLLMAHGTRAQFQWPMFGYFLAFPTLLVLLERLTRVFLGFHRIRATMKVLDGETVEITAVIPSERLWKYKAGQYIFLQVPQISFFQWHPFTVSLCVGKKMQVHIKTDGNWTQRLRALGGESGESEIEVGINGPFGAPAQRFYDFNHSLIIGAGIGVTPFSGILADLQVHDDMAHGGPFNRIGEMPKPSTTTTAASPKDKTGDSAEKPTEENENGAAENGGTSEATVAGGQSALEGSGGAHELPRAGLDGETHLGAVQSNELTEKNQQSSPGGEPRDFPDDYRRVDFHWIVRDRNYLKWLSDLLNDVSLSQAWWRRERPDEQLHLDIRINTHVTAKHKDIVTHVYRWLLEMHRTPEHPASPLTGLLNPTQFGRPDFDKILDRHYDEMVQFRASRRATAERKNGNGQQQQQQQPYNEDSGLKVGVFYCGAPVVGEILADKCHELTVRGRHDGTKIEYFFMMEVFN
ncbi:hypothetical protein SODALDRAFT_357605 [Sodiomyces alkalinus F11]|uniref:FAD-binding FR-type domain-containing protein n=1 Tax=Sodiomyces alkalinus (strain CBS 110278 / VKM F-3762 / F11) TaxID=1314773 RepID=A0A3N2Q448_SODAK|nr:hypothetical protein SODALDRAFT_357605 [Sodiomyces alkalinus F11]ROT41551.1 hypothetical protein SODALDRAFT_357605 [Sodiomyces alkalinus F11]